MYFISSTVRKTPSEALRCGLADDGSLFVPEFFPLVDLELFKPDLSYSVFAQILLHHFFINDPLETQLASFCAQAFNFPVPLKAINDNTYILELFHGPTLSFKDFGARFLAQGLNFLSADKKTTVMVATSGDTGSAVASAFYLKPKLQVIVLYPKGKISERQEHQITCWDTNVLALAIDGNFDLCQQLVKTALRDTWWQSKLQLSSANSINIGRLLPQIVYYAYISLRFYHEHHNKAPGFIIPTGNLGNATAAYWAKAMGFPIREIVCATNANLVLADYLRTGNYQPRPSITTLANAMDVGDPSNFERLRHLFPSFDLFKKNVCALSASDEEIRKTIQYMYQEYQSIVCPHTATACFARFQLSGLPWIIVATADPCKFDDIIEPLIQTKVPIAPQLETLLKKPTQYIEGGKSLEDIKEVLQSKGML